VTGDGIVGGPDIALIARHLGSHDARFDLNHDGVVSVADLLTAVRQMGSQC
jgi:hypothetical protein